MVKFIVERLMTKLGLMQSMTILAVTVMMIVGVLLIHHQTDDYFMPLPVYLSSIKISIPPIALFILSYVSAFISGTPISDVPKAILGFIRNVLMQSTLMMALVIAVGLTASCVGVAILLKSTPPAYDNLVELLLGGSSDELSLA